MNSTVVFRMASGAEHEITLPTEVANSLVWHIGRQWKAGVGGGHALHRTDGTSVTINPLHVESFHVR